MLIIMYILIFTVIGFLMGLFMDEDAAYLWIFIISGLWFFVMGPFAIATLIELIIGHSIAKSLTNE